MEILRGLGIKTKSDREYDAVRLKKAKTCSGCIAYMSRKGINSASEGCVLRFKIQPIPNNGLHEHYDKCDAYTYSFMPAEPCPKPKTLKAYTLAFDYWYSKK